MLSLFLNLKLNGNLQRCMWLRMSVFLGRPISVAYVGGSVSPYYNLNPGYRIYYVDGDHDHSTRVKFIRLDTHTSSWFLIFRQWWTTNHGWWTFERPTCTDIRSGSSCTRLSRRSEWKLWGPWTGTSWWRRWRMTQSYSTYFISNCQTGFTDTGLKLNCKNVTFVFYRYYYKASPERPICDVGCKKRILCDLRSGRSHDRKNLCEMIESRIDVGANVSWKDWFYNTLSVS